VRASCSSLRAKERTSSQLAGRVCGMSMCGRVINSCGRVNRDPRVQYRNSPGPRQKGARSSDLRSTNGTWPSRKRPQLFTARSAHGSTCKPMRQCAARSAKVAQRLALHSWHLLSGCLDGRSAKTELGTRYCPSTGDFHERRHDHRRERSA
jgi:hypothetical protein